MSAVATRVLGGVLAAATLLALAALSSIPYAPESGRQAMLRLSWRARVARVRECREPTQEELRGLPAHMQRNEICEGRVSPYLLQVSIDDQFIARDTVRPAGARHDRPLYVFREIPLTPGDHRVRVRFERLAKVSPEAQPEGTLPPTMRLDVSARAAPGDVILVTYDSDGDSLALRRPGDPSFR